MTRDYLFKKTGKVFAVNFSTQAIKGIDSHIYSRLFDSKLSIVLTAYPIVSYILFLIPLI